MSNDQSGAFRYCGSTLQVPISIVFISEPLTGPFAERYFAAVLHRIPAAVRGYFILSNYPDGGSVPAIPASCVSKTEIAGKL